MTRKKTVKKFIRSQKTTKLSTIERKFNVDTERTKVMLMNMICHGTVACHIRNGELVIENKTPVRK